MKKNPPTKRAAAKKKVGFDLPSGRKVAGVLLLLGFIATGYLGFDTFMKGYHAAFALAGDVKQQVDGLKNLLVQTQINGLQTEKRVLQRQIGDVRLQMKKFQEEDRAVLQHIVHDLEGQVLAIDGQIGVLVAKLKK